MLLQVATISNLGMMIVEDLFSVTCKNPQPQLDRAYMEAFASIAIWVLNNLILSGKHAVGVAQMADVLRVYALSPGDWRLPVFVFLLAFLRVPYQIPQLLLLLQWAVFYGASRLALNRPNGQHIGSLLRRASQLDGCRRHCAHRYLFNVGPIAQQDWPVYQMSALVHHQCVEHCTVCGTGASDVNSAGAASSVSGNAQGSELHFSARGIDGPGQSVSTMWDEGDNDQEVADIDTVGAPTDVVPSLTRSAATSKGMT
ncbi:hypothetical protein DAEQUDRAFT_741374 [Daedalea quercina L-15889]|uniref:Uncharacterized protein n=1 Tax=Daedalea quercina L-15889 TaxID=1314783 RepID=A0A165LE93_9APHY|nr:hypothetical protein DAEQUDRAFT_741374 [Daedalea quercina L-15889]